MRMLLTDFAQAAKLGDDELRTRFAHGDPQERVWCAWALGLRMQERVMPLLMHQARVDDDPGVRRHCVIMLAGAGELDLVAAIASHDSDEHVRATALQYVVRLLEDQPRALFSFVEERLRLDASAWVRAAAIGNLPVDTPENVRAQAALLLDDADPVVREACVDKLLAWRGVTDALKTHVKTEPTRSIRAKILARWWHDDGKSLLGALDAWPVALQRESLELGILAGNADAEARLGELSRRTRPSVVGALALRR